jgi:hypothetical protein
MTPFVFSPSRVVTDLFRLPMMSNLRAGCSLVSAIAKDLVFFSTSRRGILLGKLGHMSPALIVPRQRNA